MNFPLYIAKRYVRSKSSQNAVNIINFITFLVIVIGSAALFIVLSGFAGLKTYSLSFSESFDPDLKASPLTGKFISVLPEQETKLQNIDGVLSFSKELEEKVYFLHNEKSHIGYIKGVDSNYNKVTSVDSTLYFGEWLLDGQRGVVGIGIANLLGLTVNNYRSPLQILVPKPKKGAVNQGGFNKTPYNQHNVVVSGMYNVAEDLDKKYLFTSLPVVQKLLEKDSLQISAINFKIDGSKDIGSIKKEIAAVFNQNVILKDRQEQNSTLHRMLNTENLATYLIFTLVLIIALFNVVGAIIMMILDKKENSKTLYYLGSTIKELRKIYFVQGTLVTSIGGLVGVFIGSLLIWSQLAFGWLKINAFLAYPVEYKLLNVVIVLATIIVLGLISAKIASSRISKKLITQ
ncbi:MAG: FtsX-like permease family protein [Cellulophaga sp.]|uniref:ABC transporter permease n=1 Tax=unclassified Cellulophaga TaxID=2634405 RepID=UPI0026E1D02A|nr:MULTISPECIES: FtsX-like permease family protein [unclassified Cellulophaga]MDO6491336.1 ABC transporter permease [Cellulophaga sp. 2_MG-2023]MDO6495131.1 ABC transporter permease [Cellulophaga sp. 3_MG-2023]